MGTDRWTNAVDSDSDAAQIALTFVSDEDVAIADLATSWRFEELQVGRLRDKREDVAIGT